MLSSAAVLIHSQTGSAFSNQMSLVVNKHVPQSSSVPDFLPLRTISADTRGVLAARFINAVNIAGVTDNGASGDSSSASASLCHQILRIFAPNGES